MAYGNYRVKAILSTNTSKKGTTYYQVAVEPYDIDTGKTLPVGISAMFEKPEIGDEVIPRVRLDFNTNKFIFGGFSII